MDDIKNIRFQLLLDPKSAKRLACLANKMKVSKGEVLRLGLKMLKENK